MPGIPLGNQVSCLRVHFASTRASFMSLTVNVYIINASAALCSVMAATLSFHLKTKIKTINNRREISICQRNYLVFQWRAGSMNCLLVDLGHPLNPQDPTGTYRCLIRCEITAKMSFTLKKETCIQKPICSKFFRTSYLALLNWVEIKLCPNYWHGQAHTDNLITSGSSYESKLKITTPPLSKCGIKFKLKRLKYESQKNLKKK